MRYKCHFVQRLTTVSEYVEESMRQRIAAHIAIPSHALPTLLVLDHIVCATNFIGIHQCFPFQPSVHLHTLI